MPTKSKQLFLHHPTVHDLEAAVKLLARSFPAVVAPQPVLRCSVDGLLHALEIDVGQLKLTHRRGVTRDNLKFALIAPAAHALDIYIDNSLILGVDNALDACEHRSVLMIKKSEPVVDVFPLGHLIVDVTQYRGTAFSLVAEDPAQCLLLGYVVRVHAASCL